MTAVVLCFPMLIHSLIIRVVNKHPQPFFKRYFEFGRSWGTILEQRFLDIAVELVVVGFMGRIVGVKLDFVTPTFYAK